MKYVFDINNPLYNIHKESIIIFRLSEDRNYVILEIDGDTQNLHLIESLIIHHGKFNKLYIYGDFLDSLTIVNTNFKFLFLNGCKHLELFEASESNLDYISFNKINTIRLYSSNIDFMYGYSASRIELYEAKMCILSVSISDKICIVDDSKVERVIGYTKDAYISEFSKVVASHSMKSDKRLTYLGGDHVDIDQVGSVVYDYVIKEII